MRVAGDLVAPDRGGCSRGEAALLAVALIAAAANFFIGLGSSSLYVDEGLSWSRASVPLGQVLGLVAETEISPPAYYFALHELIGRVSDSEAAMRLPSAFAGVALVAATFWVATRVAGPRAGVLAAWLTALSPLVMEYAQQARAYVFAALACTLAAGALLELERGKRKRAWLLAAGLTCIAACWLHYSAALVVAPLIALTVMRGAMTRREGLLLSVAVTLACTPLLPLLGGQLGSGNTQGIAGLAQPSMENVVEMMGAPFDSRFGAQELTLAAAVGAATLVGALLLLAYHRAPRRELVLGLTLVPFAVVLVITVVGPNMLLTRYLAVAAPFMLVALGAAVALGGRRGAILGVLAGAAALAGSVAAHTKDGLYADTRAATRVLAAEAAAGDPVVLSGNATIVGGFQYHAAQSGVQRVRTAPPTPLGSPGFLDGGRSLWLWFDPPVPLKAVDQGLAARGFERTGAWRFEASEDLLLVKARRRARTRGKGPE